MSVMDDQAGEDDDYSDDDLDALPDHAFHELQENAIQSTQQPSLTAQVQLPTTEQPTRLAGHLGRLSVGGHGSHAANQRVFQAPSSDYGDFDEDMLDGEIFNAAEEPALAARYEVAAGDQELGEFSQREPSRLQRLRTDRRISGPVEAQQRVKQQGAAGAPTSNANGPGDQDATAQEGNVVHGLNLNPTGPPPPESADVNALQSQVQKVGLLKRSLYRDCLLILLFSCYVNVRHCKRPFKMPTTMLIQRLAKLLSCEPMRPKSKRNLRTERYFYRNRTPTKQRGKKPK